MDKIRQVMLLLVLVVYTGQSLLAVGAPCSMDNGAGSEMSAMEHAGHHDMAAVEASDAGCCEGGFCSMSHCQSVAALPQAFASDRVAWVSPRSPAPDLSSPEFPLELPIRPPISR